MISRRNLVRAAGLAAAALGGGVAAPARAQGAAAPIRLDDLNRLPASGAPLHVDGQGWFEPASAEGEPDGMIRIAGPDGRHWRRSGFAGALRPEWFALAADGPDETPAIQRACDHANRFGPFAVDLGNRRYRCLSRLAVDPTRTVLRGVGAVLDFAEMPEPVLHATVLTLADLNPEAGWRREEHALVHDGEAASPLTHRVPLPEAGRYRVSVVVGALSGGSDYPVLEIGMSTADREPLGTIAVIAPGTYDFDVDGEQPAARLTIATNAAVRIESLRVEAQGLRECVLIGSGEESPQYGHKWIEGIEVAGPGAGTLLDGLRFETRAAARSSRLTLRDVVVRGFRTGLVFSHRAYLIRATGLRCACEVGLHFLGGLRDAGELISLSGSVIDGGRIAVLNNDAEVAFFGTAIDFVDQVFVGSGRLTLQGCHLEVNRPKAADKPLVDLGQGNVALDGGSFTVTGADFEAGNQCDYIFMLRSRAATASMREISTYNLRSRSGALAGGPGRLDVSLMRGRRPRHMAPIVQFDPARNLLGPLPLDLRTSTSAEGAFERFPTDAPTFRVSPAFRHVWLFGRAQPGCEIGVAFRGRSDTPGRITAIVQAFDGDTRVIVGDVWPMALDTDWTTFRASTGDTHPAAQQAGRMPEGFGEIALMLDLSALDSTVELADFFLCAT